MGYGRDFLVVRFHRRQIDSGPFFKVPIALDALGVSKGLAVGLVNLVDARHDRLEIGDILVRRLDMLEEALRRDPVFPERMATRLETVAGSFGFGKVFDDVLEVKLHGVAEIEADRVDDEIDEIPVILHVGQQRFGRIKIAFSIIVKVVWTAVVTDAGVQLVKVDVFENIVLLERRLHAAVPSVVSLTKGYLT